MEFLEKAQDEPDIQPYYEAYNKAINGDTREEFWKEQAEKVQWSQFPTKILDDSNPPFYRWFSDGTINICHNAIDVNIEKGRGEQLAIIYDSGYTKTVKKYTYNQLLDNVSRLARILKETYELQKGDRVLIYMPMIPESTFAMLA